MHYGGSISPPREPSRKKRVIPRRAPVATAMAGGGDKGDGSSSPSTVVMERVTNVNGEIPKLTKANYHE